MLHSGEGRTPDGFGTPPVAACRRRWFVGGGRVDEGFDWLSDAFGRFLAGFGDIKMVWLLVI